MDRKNEFGGDTSQGVCSKRVYRILMTQSGCIRILDVENGVDFFDRHQLCPLYVK